MKRTQKEKLEQFDALYAHADLLELYLHDTQHGKIPDAVERRRNKREGNIRCALYRATSASGGYVVIVNLTYGHTEIKRLDDILDYLRAYPSGTYYPLIRECIAALNVARSKLINNEHGQMAV